MDNELFHAIKDTIKILQVNKNLPDLLRRGRVFDPATGNRKNFCRGKVGIKEIPNEEIQLISLNVAMAFYLDASGQYVNKSKFSPSEMLQTIGNSITSEHILALEGKLFTLAGIPNKWENAPLPIPLKFDFDEDEKMKLVPFVITRKI